MRPPEESPMTHPLILQIRWAARLRGSHLQLWLRAVHKSMGRRSFGLTRAQR
jgi:hypothetical protein